MKRQGPSSDAGGGESSKRGPAAPTISVIVQTLSSAACEVSLLPTALVRQLKDLVADQLGIAWDAQRLMLPGTETPLDESSRLLDNGLVDGSVIMCVQLASIKGASADLKGNKEFVLSVVRDRGDQFEFSSDAMRADREIALAAVANYPDALEFATDSVKGDREVVLAAVMQRGYLLDQASEELRNDRQIVLSAVSTQGEALALASAELQSDPEIVLAAVTNDGCSLEFASQDLCNNREVVRAAIAQAGIALVFASEEMTHGIVFSFSFRNKM